MRALAPLLLTCLLAACGDGEPLLPADARLPDGGRYRGDIVDGLLQGDGRIDYPNGAYYQGRFEDGQWQGEGVWHGANGDHYEGGFRHGLFDGAGRFTYASGGVYEGQFRGGSLNGPGRYTEPGLSYTGDFKDGLYEGAGRLQQADGSKYLGPFVRGLPNGEGVRSDTDGTFAGTFIDGVLNGPGTYQGEDGERYAGDFRNDQFDGPGRYEDAQGNAWEGRFAAGELSGDGVYSGADGTHYRGGFRHWQYHGKGELRQPDGSHYQGTFRAGRFEGRGTLTLADGSTLDGTWRAGRRSHDRDGHALADPLEVGLLRQGRLLAEALEAIPASTPDAELYSLTLGGDGEQSVFLREADYVHDLLAERFAARGGITLVNHRDHFADRPLATRENLDRAIRQLAERSGPEDLVFLYLTSHGTADHQLVLSQPRLALEDLAAADLAALLEPLAGRDKIVVISACYAGGFIEPLKDPHTLLIAAARADRVSFGCSEDSDFTYFGSALFAEALHQTRDIEQAFTLAQATVAERERADHYQASEPQIWAPQQVVEHWRALTDSQHPPTD